MRPNIKNGKQPWSFGKMDLFDWVYFSFQMSGAERRHRQTLKKLKALQEKYGEVDNPEQPPPRAVERATVGLLTWLYAPWRKRRLAKALDRAERSRRRLSDLLKARHDRVAAKTLRSRNARIGTVKFEDEVDAEITALKSEQAARLTKLLNEQEALKESINDENSVALNYLKKGIFNLLIYIFAGFGILTFIMTIIISAIHRVR